MAAFPGSRKWQVAERAHLKGVFRTKSSEASGHVSVFKPAPKVSPTGQERAGGSSNVLGAGRF